MSEKDGPGLSEWGENIKIMLEVLQPGNESCDLLQLLRYIIKKYALKSEEAIAVQERKQYIQREG